MEATHPQMNIDHLSIAQDPSLQDMPPTDENNMDVQCMREEYQLDNSQSEDRTSRSQVSHMITTG